MCAYVIRKPVEQRLKREIAQYGVRGRSCLGSIPDSEPLDLLLYIYINGFLGLFFLLLLLFLFVYLFICFWCGFFFRFLGGFFVWVFFFFLSFRLILESERGG